MLVLGRVRGEASIMRGEASTCALVLPEDHHRIHHQQLCKCWEGTPGCLIAQCNSRRILLKAELELVLTASHVTARIELATLDTSSKARGK